MKTMKCMKGTSFKIILAILFAMCAGIFAQTTGQISGKVTDAKTGDMLIGANVILVELSTGAAADMDGNYTIRNISPGTYTLRFTYVSYTTKVVNNVAVQVGETTRLDVIMQEEVIQGKEVVVEATAIMSSESAVLQQQRKAATIGDAVAADQIRRAPDATTGDALRRVTGVAVVDNKFVYVRGTSERYSNTLVNGTQLSSTEPDKKAYAFDTLPSNLLENTVISKSFTPDLPGNFSGGLVQINTVEFPEDFSIRLSISGAYNTLSTRSSFQVYQGGKYDYWGIDDGIRDLPATINGNKVISSNYSRSELQAIGQSFSNIWAPTGEKAPLNSSYMVSIGDGTRLLGKSFGYIGAFTYRNTYDRIELERNDFNADNTPQFEFVGEQNRFSTLWGGLLNLSYKLGDFHKISFKNLYNRTGDDEVITFVGNNYDYGAEWQNTGLRFISRATYSGQLAGEHAFPTLRGLKWDWRASYSTSHRDEPDYRRVIYSREMDSSAPFFANISFVPTPASGGRFYSNMNDNIGSFASDITMLLGKVKFKTGGLYNQNDREFSARNFAFRTTSQTDFNILYSDLSTLFAAEHINERGLVIDEITNRSDAYTADEKLYAGYLMFDAPVQVWSKSLRLIAGARLEDNTQKLDSFDAQDRRVNVDLQNTDILPSVNLTYNLNSATNVRAAFSRTVSRPEFRELAPFAFYDFTSVSVVYGNPGLRRALISNYDLRFEMFQRAGEILTASVFYKDFTDAIEEVIVPTTELTRSFGNADKAKNYGFELEVRKSLDFVSRALTNFSATANYTWIKSSVDIAGSTTAIGRSGRRLQGQSPYAINLGLLYTDLKFGTSISMLYNRFGERIAQVGSLYDEDIVELPRDLIDITVSQNLARRYEIKISAKDILGQEQVFKEGDLKVRGNKRGSTYTVGLSIKL
ncbi:MAG: TonB-dependent receptor domain-containing protein [bacterium]